MIIKEIADALSVLEHLQTADNELRDSCIAEIKTALKRLENGGEEKDEDR